MLVGIALGVVTVVVLAADPTHRVSHAALLLAGIGAVYVGFAVIDGRPRVIAVESASAITAWAIAAAALTWDSAVVAGVGYLAHAGWDAAHHREDRGGTSLASAGPWYPSFCAAYDLTVAVPLIVLGAM